MHTVTSTLAPLHPSGSQFPMGFKHDFFELPASSSAPGSGSQSAGARRIHYCKDTYPTHAAFCESDDFLLYQIEVRQQLDFFSAFCRDHGMPDADIIAARFDLLYEHRFHEQYFRDQASIFDSLGKQSLDSICAMVGDERISAEKKQAAIRNLSEGANVCAGGVLAYLIAADRELTVSTQSIKAMLWKAKEEIIRDEILQEVSVAFSGQPLYEGDEIHYVNAVWNYLADTLGLIAIPDAYAENLDVEFLAACQRKIVDRLTPDRLARYIAEQLQGLFISRYADLLRASAEQSAHDIEADFLEILENIRIEYQLESDALGLHAFVRFDDSRGCYEVRSDPSLIARDLLTLMHREGLLNVAPVNRGEWIDGDGPPRALFTYGRDLAWRAVPPAMPPDMFTWDAGQDAELLTTDDLRAWSLAWRPEGQAPPGAAVLQAIHSAESAALPDIPDNWLADARVMLAMLANSDGEQVQRRFQANFSYLLTKFPVADRARLIHEHFGSGPAIVELARGWYTGPWALMRLQVHGQKTFMLQRWMASDNWRAIDALLHHTDGGCYLHTGAHVLGNFIFRTLAGLPEKPALYEAMDCGHVKAIQAWHRLLADPSVIDRITTRVMTLLEGRSARMPALATALSKGHAGAIGAFHGLLADTAITRNIQHGVAQLLAAFTGWGVPGLLFAMEHGHAEAVQAFHAMLVDRAVLPYIVKGLPTLVTARIVIAGTPAGTTGLIQAMMFGRAEVIRAFHAMLADPRILPHISHALPGLLTARPPDGAPALAVALANGQVDAIKAFHQLLVDPAIMPHIKRCLPKLLRARTSAGDTGLGLALKNGRTDAVRAFHEMLKDPVIRPWIRGNLPELLAAKRRDGTYGLSLALRNNRAQTIAAFGDVLADPLILPSIRHKLDKLLTARDSSGQPGLLQAIRANQSAAVAAFYQVLDRPELAGQVSGELSQALRELPALQVASTVEAAGVVGQVNAQGTERAGARDARRVNAWDAGYGRASVMRFVRRMIRDVGRRLMERWRRSA